MKTSIAPLLSASFLSACAIAPAPSASPFTHGVASGDMRDGSAVIWTRAAGPARLTPQLSLTPGFESPTDLPPVDAGEESDFTVKAIATSLGAGTRYYYRFKSGDAVSPVGTFRTPYAADDHATVRMAFTGDADWKWKPYPVAAALVQENLDFFFFLGDLVYETLDLKGTRFASDLPGYRAKYRENREPRPGTSGGRVPMRDLYAAFGQYAVFDNHELGVNTEGGARTADGFANRSAGFGVSVRAFGEYQPMRLERVAGTGDARMEGTYRFYRSIPWGANVEMIVLDDRSYRDARIRDLDSPAADACDRTMLGAPQLAWFQEALQAAQRRGAVWKLVVISSPMQELGRGSQSRYEIDSAKGWAGNYRCERSRVLKFIDDHAIDNVVFITTDYHFTAINNLVYDSEPGDPRSPRKRARNAFEIMTGPMGAIAGSPLRNYVPMTGLGTREADARIVALMNEALRDASLDPIGLEPDFPGLDRASIRIASRPPGAPDALAFASFASYSYVVLTFDQSRVHVQLKLMPYVEKPEVLDDPAARASYEARRPEEASSFSVMAR